MQQSDCLVINASTDDSLNEIFNYTPVDRTSECMEAQTSGYSLYYKIKNDDEPRIFAITVHLNITFE